MQSLDQLLQLDLSGSDAEHGRDRSVQYMIYALVTARLLVGRQVSCVLHHHDHPVIALAVGADRADLPVRQSITFLAITDILFCLNDGICKPVDLILRHVNQMKRQSLR